ncbi:unnamed protein product, partial [marine sediment metagenome]
NSHSDEQVVQQTQGPNVEFIQRFVSEINKNPTLIEHGLFYTLDSDSTRPGSVVLTLREK